MKYKKYTYIIVLILMLVIGIDKTYAAKEGSSKTCYYISSDDNLRISLRIGYGYEGSVGSVENLARTTIWQTAQNETPLTVHKVENWIKDVKHEGIKVEKIYDHKGAANDDPDPSCPRAVIYTSCPGWFFGLGTSETTLATNSDLVASQVVSATSSECSYAKTASNFKNGRQITDDMFFTDYITSGLIKYDEATNKYTCADVYEMFGDKDDPESVRYMINEILWYVRIIVPILVILLGTIDFAKAVIAGKEDNMKKAQKDFIKRIIAGVVVFLIPTFIDILMGFADIVWAGDYSYCKF